MARITLRLPDDLHARLLARSRASGRSLNQLIVDDLAHAAREKRRDATSERDRLVSALGDLVVPWEILDLSGQDDEDIPLLTHTELQERMPSFSPPLSQAIIDERADRL